MSYGPHFLEWQQRVELLWWSLSSFFSLPLLGFLATLYEKLKFFKGPKMGAVTNKWVWGAKIEVILKVGLDEPTNFCSIGDPICNAIHTQGEQFVQTVTLGNFHGLTLFVSWSDSPSVVEDCFNCSPKGLIISSVPKVYRFLEQPYSLSPRAFCRGASHSCPTCSYGVGAYSHFISPFESRIHVLH